jgi:hypothetical protein
VPITSIKQKETNQASESPVATRKQDPAALRNQVLKNLHKSSEVDIVTLVQRVTDKPDPFDSFDPNVFHSKLK